MRERGSGSPGSATYAAAGVDIGAGDEAVERIRQVVATTARPGVLGGIGVAACLAGFAFAVWARIELGRNWGMPMSLKEGHELVTAGPYAYVRHPIYGGILLAVLGSALAESPAWLVLLAIFSVYFLYSAKTEEGLMRTLFPGQYPDYVRKTKMLIPFVF